MGFVVASSFARAAAVINGFAADKFEVVLSRVLSKLHEKEARLFTVEEEAQLCEMFSVDSATLNLALDAICFAFEQAAFTSTGPEDLANTVTEGGFDAVHAKILGRVWASSAAEYVAKLKDTRLGFSTLSGVDYHIHMTVGQNDLARQQEPRGVFELEIDHDPLAGSKENTEKLILEFNHEQLYDFFQQLERIQQQLDGLKN